MNSENNISCFIDWNEFLYIFNLLFPNYFKFLENNDSVSKLNNKNKLKTLFSSETSQISNALDQLQTILYRSSKRNPLSVVITHTLIKNYVKIIQKNEISEDFQKILCFDLLRAITQITDQNHSKDFKHSEQKTMKNILKTINMKEFSVMTELRHCSTHRSLPSVLILKNCLFYLIFWIFKRFWLVNFKKILKEKSNNREKDIKNVLEFEFLRKEIRKNVFENLVEKDCLSGFDGFLKRFDKINYEIASYVISELFHWVFKVNLAFSSYFLVKNKQIYINKIDKINENLIEAIKQIVFLANKEKNLEKIISFPFVKQKIVKLVILERISKYFARVKDILKESIQDFDKIYSNFNFLEKNVETKQKLLEPEENNSNRKFRKADNFNLSSFAAIYKSQMFQKRSNLNN